MCAVGTSLPASCKKGEGDGPAVTARYSNYNGVITIYCQSRFNVSKCSILIVDWKLNLSIQYPHWNSELFMGDWKCHILNVKYSYWNNKPYLGDWKCNLLNVHYLHGNRKPYMADWKCNLLNLHYLHKNSKPYTYMEDKKYSLLTLKYQTIHGRLKMQSFKEFIIFHTNTLRGDWSKIYQ